MINKNINGFKSDKIIGLILAAKKILEIKKSNKTVGLCHGGFDLLHPGHLKHFESASKLCDYLFVSITSDKYVESRKGSNRPIFSDKIRAYSVASICYVDHVVISDFERANEVLELLKPSYYIKGPDFINKKTPGIISEKNKAKELGMEMKYTTDQKLSTTEIINYIQNNLKRKKILLGIDRDGTLIEEVEYLGKDDDWKKKIKLKKNTVDLISYIQTKFDTTKIVISNQQGVARNFFTIETVENINSKIDALLRENGIIIDNWQFCPDVDNKFIRLMKDVKFNPSYIKEKSKRKPNPEMLFNGLSKLNKNIKEFDKVVIIGNSQDDKETAKNLNVKYLDVTDNSYETLKKNFDNP